jgi:hypothetical protein
VEIYQEGDEIIISRHGTSFQYCAMANALMKRKELNWLIPLGWR